MLFSKKHSSWILPLRRSMIFGSVFVFLWKIATALICRTAATPQQKNMVTMLEEEICLCSTDHYNTEIIENAKCITLFTCICELSANGETMPLSDSDIYALSGKNTSCCPQKTFLLRAKNDHGLRYALTGAAFDSIVCIAYLYSLRTVALRWKIPKIAPEKA